MPRKRRKIKASPISQSDLPPRPLLPKQLELIHATDYVVGLIGGYGSGKSEGGGNKAVQLAVANPGYDGMIVAPTHKMLIRVTLPAFKRAAGKLIREHYKADQYFEMRTGGSVWYGSADSAGSLEGTNLAWWWLDEARLLQSREAYDILLGRLRIEDAPLTQGVITTTPVAGGWLQDEFDGGKPGRRCIHTSSRENWYLKKGYVDNLLASYSPAQARAYIDGEWVTLSGAVYPEYDTARHVVDYLPDPALPVIAGLDFGFRWPAVVYAQQLEHAQTMSNGVMAPPGSLVVFSEDVPDDISTESLAIRVAERFRVGGGLRLDWIACDPAGSLLSPYSSAESSGLTDVTALKRGLADAGLGGVRVRYVYGKGSGPIRGIGTGIEKVRARMLNARGETRLFFARSLGTQSRRGLLRALPAFAYADGTSTPIRGKASGQIDHVLDGLRYLVRHVDMAHARVEQWV